MKPRRPCPPCALEEIVLEANGLVRRFGSNLVLDHVDLRIRRGECYVIMGPSGAGKSVLLRHLAGLAEPDEGTVCILGADIHCIDEENRPPLSIVFQSAALLNSLTVGENVGLAMIERNEPIEEVRRVVRQNLELVGLPDVEDYMPPELSGGMRKRVAIARALSISSEIIFYDEPTSELDPITAARIAELMDRLQKRLRRTAVVVTHDRDLAYFLADRVGILHGGRIICEGSPDEVWASRQPEIREFLDVHIGTLSAGRRQ